MKRDIACAICLVLAVGLGGGVGDGDSDGPEPLRCMDYRERNDWRSALGWCQAELLITGDVRFAIAGATAAFYLQDLLRTAWLARIAVGSERSADAYYYLGATKLLDGDHAGASADLAEALERHTAEGDFHGRARDAHQLAGARFGLGDYAGALEAVAVARVATVVVRDWTMLPFLEMAEADLLRVIGDLDGAEQTLARALVDEQAGPQVELRLKQGILHLDSDRWQQAADPLRRALALERNAKEPRAPMLEAIHLNLAAYEHWAGELARALDHLDQAHASDDDPSYLVYRGVVLDQLGRRAEADAALAAAEAARPSGEWSWWVPFQRAVVAAGRGEAAAAEAFDRTAIARVAMLAARSGRFGSTVIANHRAPYVHLIGLLAARQRWLDALEVVAMMDARSLLTSRDAARGLGPIQPDTPVDVVAPPPLPPDPAGDVLAAWRDRRLVIVVPAGGRMLRLDVRAGAVTGSDVGDERALVRRALELEADPGVAEVADELSRALLPEAAPGERLELLAIGPVARAPLAALRIAGRPAFERVLVSRAPGVLPWRGASRAADDRVIVIGDPTGDLAGAAREARRVGGALGVAPLVGASATRAAFAAVRGAGMLHVAAHTTPRLDGAALDLHDGPLSHAELTALVPAPRLVVLASCGSARGRDDAGNGSLALTFLDAGAGAVVATRWSVVDADTGPLIDAFYAAGGARDPVRALADAQRATAAQLPARTWAAFEVLTARP